VESLVESLSLKGYGIADGVEIAHVIPGDKISYELTRQKRLPKKGRLLAIHTPSKDRVEPKCIHANTCGGCCWQQMSYEKQLQVKQDRVQNAFKDFDVKPIIAAPSTFHYRNKMEFSFSENRAGMKYLGLMIAQAEPYVFNVTECHLTNSWMTEALNSVRTWWQSSQIKAYNVHNDSGSLRYLTLREGMRTGEKMAILNVSGNPEFALTRSDLDGFVQHVGEGISVFIRIHQTKKGKPTQFFEMHLSGKDHIVEKLELDTGILEFKISPISFFQPNTYSAEILYNTAISYLDNSDVVFDLYSGTGTLAMIASKKAKKVVAIELSAEAVLDAEENKKRNHIENVTFHQGDVGKVLSTLKQRSDFQKPDVVIVDPPRAGLDSNAIEHITEMQPKKIIYISCNPITQAENIKDLQKLGYKLKLLQPLDQFPHTYHIENIALLER
jgi:23S rRNA (uracil1939-C5)-methyltransferase